MQNKFSEETIIKDRPFSEARKHLARKLKKLHYGRASISVIGVPDITYSHKGRHSSNIGELTNQNDLPTTLSSQRPHHISVCPNRERGNALCNAFGKTDDRTIIEMRIEDRKGRLRL